MERSTGALSFITVFLGFVGALSKLATVLIESDDFWYRIQFIFSAVFNTIIVLQFFCFPADKEKEKKVQDDKKVQEEPKETKKTK